MGFLDFHWRTVSYIAKDFEQIIEEVPTGSRLFSAIKNVNWEKAALIESLLHLPTYGIMRRGLFVPSLFADQHQQPVYYKAPYDDLIRIIKNANIDGTYYGDGRPISCGLINNHFDYMLVISHEELHTSDNCGNKLIARKRILFLYKIQ